MLVCPTCGSTYTRSQEHCGLDGSKLVRSESDPLIGQSIDKYRIGARLGSGGMATVYRARHEFLDKDYAIKVLHGQIAADVTMARRFQREAKTLGQIKHPNVVSVDNFGATPAGLLYMVMEFLDGATLGRTLRNFGPFAPGRAADIVRQIATGLQAAHRKGFVHRDLKPGNVMLVDDEHDGEMVKLLDFGLVAILSDDEHHTQLTQAGQFFGTPMYMAPEQITGNAVGPATDLYSLGVMLYQMLAGTPPFTGDLKKLAFHHVQNAPPPLASSFGGLSELALQLMAKAPNDRPTDAGEVIDKIDELALTPVSKRLRRRPATDEAELEPLVNHTLEADADEEDPALSAPVLQEERAFRTAHEAELELRSVKATLERQQRRTRFLSALLVLVVGVAGLVFVLNGNRFEIDALQELLHSAPDAPPGQTPSPLRLPTDGPSVETLRPVASSPVTEADARTQEGTPEQDEPPPPPTARPGSEPQEGPANPESATATGGADAPATVSSEPDELEAPAYDGPPRDFATLDAALEATLRERGLTFTDVVVRVDQRAVERWSELRTLMPEHGERVPSPKRLEFIYRKVDDAVRRLEIDEELVKGKILRVQTELTFRRTSGIGGQPGLQTRLDDVRASLDQAPPTQSLDELATELSALELALASPATPEADDEPTAAEDTPPDEMLAVPDSSTAPSQEYEQPVEPRLDDEEAPIDTQLIDKSDDEDPPNVADPIDTRVDDGEAEVEPVDSRLTEDDEPDDLEAEPNRPPSTSSSTATGP